MKNKKQSASRRDFLRGISLATPAIMAGPFLAGAKYSTGELSAQDAGLSRKPGRLSCDLLVYGATSAGVIAAYTAKMYGLSVLLVEPGRHLGGMTSGGLGRTDTGGQDSYITGLSQEFYIRVGQYYGQKVPAYTFEPHVAELIFKRYVDEAEVEVLFSRRVQSVRVKNAKIRSVDLEYAGIGSREVLTVDAHQFIDATYEGDLMARAGVSYATGRESNSVYNEKYNGVIPGREAGPYGQTVRTREWGADVDPYVIPGKPDSGLLPEVNGIGHAPVGTGDDKIQAYCFRLCLTQDKENQVPLSEPEGYDPGRYELMARLQKLKPWERLRNGFIISPMPRGKTDINNYGLVGFSANYVGGNYDYPDGDYATRARVWNEHKKYQQGLWWFLATDDRIPTHIRQEVKTWGYCRDEFMDTEGWPHQLYIREARRMVSDFVMTEHECVGARPITDGIAKGGYALDSHVVQRVVVDGHVENEGNISVHGFDPYLISYRSIIPKRKEIHNLCVPVCVSSSHAAYGSLRMEPVFMALGQAAAVAARLAMESGKILQDVPAASIQRELTENPLVNRKIPAEFADILPFRAD
jgi:hypothetical protein